MERRQRALALAAGAAAALLYLSASALQRRFASQSRRGSATTSDGDASAQQAVEAVQAEPHPPPRAEPTATAAAVLRRARRRARKAREQRELCALKGEDLVIVVDIGSSSVRCAAFAVGTAVRVHVAKTEQAAARFTEAATAAATAVHRRNARTATRLRRSESSGGESDANDGTLAGDRVRMVPGSLVRVVLSSHGKGAATSQSWGTPAVIEANGTADVSRVVRSVELAVDRCLGSLRRGLPSFRVVAVTFDSFVMNWFGVDSAGRPCTPAYTFADQSPDTVAHASALRWELKRNGGSEMLHESHQRTGVPCPHPSYLPALLRRLSAEQAALRARKVPARTGTTVGGGIAALSCWQTLSSHIVARWAGKATMPVSYSEASWTGLLDIRHCIWDDQTINVSALRAEIHAADSTSHHVGTHGPVVNCVFFLQLLNRQGPFAVSRSDLAHAPPAARCNLSMLTLQPKHLPALVICA